MNQRDLILNYMQTHGSITPLEALRVAGCMRLSERIRELEKDGWLIKHDWEKSEKKKYSKYVLVDQITPDQFKTQSQMFQDNSSAA